MKVTAAALSAVVCVALIGDGRAQIFAANGVRSTLAPSAAFMASKVHGVDFMLERRRRNQPKSSSMIGMSAVESYEQKSTEASAVDSKVHVDAHSHASQEVSSEPSLVGRTAEEIAAELSSGRLMKGGHVIDYGSVKDHSSRAETALRDARRVYELRHDGQSAVTAVADGTISNRLMGINDEVVKEVGREIGAFATDAGLIQRCASYLRSRAQPGVLESDPAASNEEFRWRPDEVAEYEALLERSYEESGVVTSAFAKTFYMGTTLLPHKDRRAIWAVYVWCRRTDEIVDAPREIRADSDEDGGMLSDLSEWEIRLERLFKYGAAVDVLDLALLDTRISYSTLPIEPFADMIRGMLMDIPGLGQDRYDTFEQLHLYCYRVAGTVGLMSMPIFGCAEGCTEKEAKEPALSLGVAFQITNILRDVGEDASQRGRIYLPREDMEKFGVTEEQIFAQRKDENYVRLMKHEISRARMYYERAQRGVFMLAPHSRWPVQSSLDAYGRILEKIEENGYDSLTQRAYVSKWEKVLGLPMSWLKTLDVAKPFLLEDEDGEKKS